MFDDIIANSARQVEELSRQIDEKNQQEAAHRAKLEAGAEADIAQKRVAAKPARSFARAKWAAF